MRKNGWIEGWAKATLFEVNIESREYFASLCQNQVSIVSWVESKESGSIASWIMLLAVGYNVPDVALGAEHFVILQRWHGVKHHLMWGLIVRVSRMRETVTDVCGILETVGKQELW